jgi:2-methylisocitrate lyase-like PEP mutase family enzyme
MHESFLVLPNAWDPLSAHVVEAAGAKAIATTSAGVAWSRGVRDGGGLDRDTALDAVARIVGSVEVPVSADLERGYHQVPAEVASTVSHAIDLGVAGVNIEDSTSGCVVAVADQSDLLSKIAAAVEDAGVPIFVNARTDTFLFAEPGRREPEDLLEETIARGRRYADAGADGLFVPGLGDPTLVRRLVRAVDLPVNVMAGAGPTDLSALASLGVRRVSWGSQVAQSTYGWLQQQVHDLLDTGGVSGLAPGIPFAEANRS